MIQDYTKSKLLEDYEQLLQKYDSLQVMSDIVIDTSEREKKVLEQLIAISKEFIQFQDEVPDYHKICDVMLDISGAKYVTLNIFDDNGLDFTSVAMVGIKENIKKAISFLGFNLENKKWKHDPVRAKKTQEQTITQFKHVSDLSGKIIPPHIIRLIEKTFNLGETYVVKISNEQKVYGDFTLLFNRNDTIQNHRFVELYANQLALFFDRLKVTSAVSESEKKLRTITNAARDAIVMLDANETITYWNPAAELIFGYSHNEAIGKNLHELLVPSKQLAAHLIAFENFKKYCTVESHGRTLDIEAKKKDNSDISVQLSLSSIPINNEWFSVGIIRDISEYKLIQKEILHKNEMLHTLLAEKDKFFSIISHDLRSPFASIVNLLEYMAEKTETMSEEEIKEFAQSAYQTSKSTFNLLENLLEWSRLQRNVMPFEPIQINLHEFVGSCDITTLQMAQQKDISLTFDIPNGVLIKADENMLRSILRNLITNAIKFTQKGGNVGVKASKVTPSFVTIAVQDNGIGMEKSRQEMLFKIDTKVSRPGTEGELSSGLGLILCKEFIEKHNGDLWVESEVNKGSTFYFNIPSA